MVRTTRSTARRSRPLVQVQKPNGSVAARVQRVGPAHFGILSIDVAKARFKMMLADFYGKLLFDAVEVELTRGGLQAAVDRVRQAQADFHLHDLLVAIERTGEYHRPIQRAFREAGFEVRLVHPLASKQFRQAADPGNKTDETDLAGIHRAAVNGFGLIEPTLPSEAQQLQLLVRHRRDLVQKMSAVCCQLREHLHAAMPGYAACFEDLWASQVALLIARATGSAAAVKDAGLPGLLHLLQAAGRRSQLTTLHKVLAWTDTAPPAHPHPASLLPILHNLDDDRLEKIKQIRALERSSAAFLTRTPYVLLLASPGINVVSAAELAGEMGPIAHYANANAITGRAGLVPARYQSDLVDRPHGSLIRCANRKLRTALLQIADNLVACNHHCRAKAALWKHAGKNARWIRVKIAKSFSRIAYGIVAGRRLAPHPCLQHRHYILDKLNAFHGQHETPMAAVLDDLKAAVDQLPQAEQAPEAKPLQEELDRINAGRRRGPQPLRDIIPIVLARLGMIPLQSTPGQDLS